MEQPAVTTETASKSFLMPGEYITSEALFQHHHHIALDGDLAGFGFNQVELDAVREVVHLGAELQVMPLDIEAYILDGSMRPRLPTSPVPGKQGHCFAVAWAAADKKAESGSAS